MVGIEYIQSILNEFLGDEKRELVVISKFNERPVSDISESASSISDSEVTCASKGGEAKDEE